MAGKEPESLGDFMTEYRDWNEFNNHPLHEDNVQEESEEAYEKSLKSREIITVNCIIEKVKEAKKVGFKSGISTGYDSLDEYFTVKPCEMTIVTGIPGSGKTTFVDNICIRMAFQSKWKFAVLSAENLPHERHVLSLVEKHYRDNIETISDSDFDKAIDFLNDHFFFLNPSEEDFTISNILKLCEDLYFEKGIDCLIIDPWNELEHKRPNNQSETEYIGCVLSAVRRFSRLLKIHTFIVAHPTKLQLRTDGTYPIPTPYDISGCHSSDTEVLTENGWKLHSDINLLNGKLRVACFDCESNLMSYQYPLKTWVYEYKGEMVRLSSPSFDALVTPNHRMVLRPAWQRKHQMIGSGLGRPQKYERDMKWNFVLAKNIQGEMEMPWATAWQDKSNINKILGYPAKGFLQFLGWWISEGWLNKVSGGIGICQGEGELAEKMKRVMSTSGINFTSSVGPPGTEGKIKSWKAYIGLRKNREVCKWIPRNCGIGAKNKHLPEITWKLSNRQKGIILSALIEGDGCITGPDTFSYSTVSEQLANDVQRLSIECGRMAILAMREPQKSNHNRQYQINIGRKSRKHISLRKHRHITKEYYDGDVYCLTVPTGAYLIRRNGKVGIYGNSSNWRNKADNCLSLWWNYKDVGSAEVHIQKIRFREVGKLGMVRLDFNTLTGVYSDPF